MCPIANAKNDTIVLPNNLKYSAQVLYDSVCTHIDSGRIEIAEQKLRSILSGLNEGIFEECTDEEAMRHLQYKSHVALANLAMAEKKIKELTNEMKYFETVDTIYGLSVWFLHPDLNRNHYDSLSVSKTYDNSAWVVYDSVCTLMNKGMISRAEIGLWTILEGTDEGLFMECSDDLAMKQLKYKSHVILANIAMAETRLDELDEALSFFKKNECFGLPVCFTNPFINDTMIVEAIEEKPYSAWATYDSVVNHIHGGEIELAKSKLARILSDLDKGKFEECSDEHTTRLLQYKSHVILANIAFAEKDSWDLDREVSFFVHADTSHREWKRARFAATHFKHKYYQLLKNRKYGKVVGDWVSLWKNKDGIPMVWIRFFISGNTLRAELKDCAMKSFLSTKYPALTDNIAIDNLGNTIEVDFGDSRLRPGLQFLPNAAIDIVNDASNMFSEAIARQSTAKSGTPYTSEATLKQLGVDMAATLAVALLTQLSVTKETVVSESFVMEQISPEFYMAKINLHSLTVYSDGRRNDDFQWAEIPIIHLYPNETQDFSKGHFDKSIIQPIGLITDELLWEITEENYETKRSIATDIIYGCMGICNVENTQFDGNFYFLGRDINHKFNSTFSTSFTGVAQSSNLFGLKEKPVNPRTNHSEANLYITPLRGEFKTIISPTECITFTGDWNAEEKCGNGLLSYVSTDAPEFNFTYEGTIWKGYPHGLGIWQGEGYRYVGWFYEGKKFGYGTMLQDDGRQMQGFVKESGTMVFEDAVTDEMRKDFNNKVNEIATHKYKVLDE